MQVAAAEKNHQRFIFTHPPWFDTRKGWTVIRFVLRVIVAEKRERLYSGQIKFNDTNPFKSIREDAWVSVSGDFGDPYSFEDGVRVEDGFFRSRMSRDDTRQDITAMVRDSILAPYVANRRKNDTSGRRGVHQGQAGSSVHRVFRSHGTCATRCKVQTRGRPSTNRWTRIGSCTIAFVDVATVQRILLLLLLLLHLHSRHGTRVMRVDFPVSGKKRCQWQSVAQKNDGWPF